MLINQIQNNFLELITFLNEIETAFYTEKHSELSNATIGEHIRHSIEMYQCLTEQYANDSVNYDKRNRNYKTETETSVAILAIQKLKKEINKPNKTLVLQQGLPTIYLEITTNYYRELYYCLEHSIHHQALIKVALLKQPSLSIPDNFGVAPATINYRKQCAQ